MNVKPCAYVDEDGNLTEPKDEIYMLLPVRMKD